MSRKRCTPEAEDLLRERVKEWEEKYQRVVKELKRDPNLGAAEANDQPSRQDLNEIVSKIEQKARERSAVRDQAFVDMCRTTPGSLAASIARLDKGLLQNLQNQRELVESERQSGEATLDDEMALRNAEASTEFFRREVLRGQSFLKATKALVKVGLGANSYIGGSIALCELARGRELCVGRELSISERFGSLCKYALKMGMKWPQLRDVVVGDSLDSVNPLLLGKMESALR